jgi:hypothetical protein
VMHLGNPPGNRQTQPAAFHLAARWIRSIEEVEDTWKSRIRLGQSMWTSRWDTGSPSSRTYWFSGLALSH